MMEMIWETTAMGALGLLFFIFIVVRGVPLRMGIARMRHRTFVVVDNDTHYTAPKVKKEKPELVETTDGRVWGKIFRIKQLGGIKIGIAVPDDFLLYEPTMAAAVEKDNEEVDDPEKYEKMEDSKTEIQYAGRFVRMSEITKGMTKKRSPVLIKSAMSRAAEEAIAAKEREPTKLGMMILLACLGIGILMILLSKAGLF